MKNRLGNLLEEKRGELGETVLAFAGRLFRRTPTMSIRVFYYQVLNGQRRLPKKHFDSAAQILGLSISEVETLNQKTSIRFTGDELRRLAEAADALGKPLSIETMLQILSDLRESPSV